MTTALLERPRQGTALPPPVILETRVVTGTGGGPDKTILNTPRFLDPYGYRTICAFLHPPDDPGFETLREKAADLKAELVSIPDRGPFDLRVVRSLIRLCKERKVDVWHGHDYKSNALGLLVRRFHRMRLITTVHGWPLTTRRAGLYYRIDRWCLKRYEQVICVSADLLKEVRRGGVSEWRSSMIDNGIDMDHYGRSRTPLIARCAMGIPARSLLVGAVGRLSPEKNFAMLIRAVDHLIERGMDVHLMIAGDGPERPALEALIAERNRSDRIRLLGFQSDPRHLYEICDVFALSSDSEGLPNVLLEAMASRVPVVATRVGGIPTLISHERNGLLVERGDEQGLTTSLTQLLRDVKQRDRFGEAGRATIEDRYGFGIRIQKMVDLYERLGITPQPQEEPESFEDAEYTDY